MLGAAWAWKAESPTNTAADAKMIRANANVLLFLCMEAKTVWSHIYALPEKSSTTDVSLVSAQVEVPTILTRGENPKAVIASDSRCDSSPPICNHASSL